MAQKKILIVDDEPEILDCFEQVFSYLGYRAVKAESAERALEILSETPIPVIFLDLNLPQMNGIDLCRTIKQRFPQTVIHAVTGYSDLYEVAACYEAGVDDYFEKPVTIKILREAAENAFAKLERLAQPK